jgi:DNA-binding IclR family transcriptional regulator
VTSKRGPYRTKSKDTHDQVLKLIAAAKDGISAAQIAEYLEIPRKTAYNCLYGMTQRGEVVRDGKLYHRIPVNA